MPRYFLEVFYKGEGFSGFQVQHNANTIQSEIEKAFQVYFRKPVSLTGSSRTDAGVHALQNYFHFDWEEDFPKEAIYNINAILPMAIVVKSIRKVKNEAHCRFHAVEREYKYFIYSAKDPFLEDRAWHLPYTLNKEVLSKCADIVKQCDDFTAFSKKNTQVRSFKCNIIQSEWINENECLIYHVKANRFLRGMVRGLVGTMVRIARGNMTIEEFKKLVTENNLSSADFSAPSKGLFLVSVTYPNDLFL